jgi:hypothetical protein
LGVTDFAVSGATAPLAFFVDAAGADRFGAGSPARHKSWAIPLDGQTCRCEHSRKRQANGAILDGGAILADFEPAPANGAAPAANRAAAITPI